MIGCWLENLDQALPTVSDITPVNVQQPDVKGEGSSPLLTMNSCLHHSG